VADGKFTAGATFEAGEANQDAALTFDARFNSASDGGPAFAATAGFHFRGTVPAWLGDLASNNGVKLDGLGPIALNGDATFRRSTEAGAASPWVVESNNIELSLNEGTLGLPGAGLELAGVGGDAKLALSLSPRGAELRLLPASRLHFAPQESRGLPVSIRNAKTDERSLALHPTGEGVRLSMPFGQKPSLDGGLQLDPFDLVQKSAQIAMTGVTLQLPIAINTAAASPGKLAVTGLRWGDDAFPPMVGGASFVDGRLLANFDWSPVADAQLHADAWFDVLSRRGHIDMKAPAFTVSDNEALGRQLSVLKPYKIKGTFAVEGRIDLDRGRVDPDLRLTLSGVDLHSDEFDAGAEGVTGSVTLNGLTPLTTPGDQRLNIEATHFGKLTLHNGLIAFRVERIKTIFVEKTEWRWGEKGRFFIHAFRFDPAKGQADLEVFLEEMSLDEWLNVLTDGKVVGQGTMFGRLPVHIRPGAANRVSFGEGYLYAKPGVGSLRVRDTEMADQLLTQTDPRFATDERMKVVKDRTIAALRDFDYSWLRFDFVRNDSGLTLRVSTNGKGHTGGPNAQEVTLDVNVNGFDDLLRGALFLKLGTPEAIDSALQRVLGQ
jgi:Dicarboxylate transport